MATSPCRVRAAGVSDAASRRCQTGSSCHGCCSRTAPASILNLLLEAVARRNRCPPSLNVPGAAGNKCTIIVEHRAPCRHEAAVDSQHAPGDPGGVRAGEKLNGRGDVLRLAGAAQDGATAVMYRDRGG